MGHNSQFPHTECVSVLFILWEVRKILHPPGIEVEDSFPKFIIFTPRTEPQKIEPLSASVQKNETQLLRRWDANKCRLARKEVSRKITDRSFNGLVTAGDVIPFQTTVCRLDDTVAVDRLFVMTIGRADLYDFRHFVHSIAGSTLAVDSFPNAIAKGDILRHSCLMARDNTYNRLNRLDLLASRLKADELMTITMLATEFGVSKRTLSRDIALLRDRGLPIEADAGRGGGIRIHRTWGVGRLALSYQEAIELLFSIAIAEKLEAPWAFMNTAAIRRKLAASFSSTLRDRIKGLRERIHVSGATSPQILSSFSAPQPDCMTVIFQAFLEMRSLKMTYSDADGHSSTRDIEPHHLLLCPPVWYLYAWDDGKNAVRCFRCDRIQNASLEDATFPQRPYDLFEGSITSMGGSAI